MKEKFLENYFRTLFISFWIIVWYKWIVLSNIETDYILLISFITLSIIYITLNLKKERYEILTKYRISIIFSFAFSSISLLVLPTNILFLNIKTLVNIICGYISYKTLFKYHIEEGLVGIISSILLLVITFLY